MQVNIRNKAYLAGRGRRGEGGYRLFRADDEYTMNMILASEMPRARLAEVLGGKTHSSKLRGRKARDFYRGNLLVQSQ